MTQAAVSDAARNRWAALGACLLDFQAFPGRYPLAMREPRLLFDHGTEVLILASGRPAEGMPQDESLRAQMRQAACFFVRTAMLRPGSDHYTLMGLTPNSDAATLREHYRMLMRLTHPDFSGGGRAWPHDAATRINQANDVLSSPMGRQNYDRTLSGSKHPLWQPAQGHARTLATRARPSPMARLRPGHSLAGRRRIVLGALVGGGVLAVVAWWLSGTHEPDRTLAVSAVQQPAPSVPAHAAVTDIAVPSGVKAPEAGQAVAETSLASLPAPVSVAAAEARSPGPEPVESRTAPRQAPVSSTGLANRYAVAAGGSLPGMRPGAIAASPAVPSVSPALPLATASAGLLAAAPDLPTSVAQPSPPVTRAAPANAAVKETYAPAGRLSMEDVQPLLGQVLGVLQSGRGEQVQRWMDRPVRAGDGADGFVQVYNRAVVNARVVRLGTVRFSGRPAGDGLLVDGMVTLHMQDEHQQSSTRELALRAQFSSRDGQAVLTRLSASETAR